MDTSLLQVLLTAVKTVARNIRRVMKAPEEERVNYWEVVEDTFLILNTTLNNVITRLLTVR